MKRLVIAAAVLTFAMLSCGQVEGPSSIQGRLIGADGEVPPMAHVHLLALGDDLGNTLKSVRVADDGSFKLELPDQGYYDMLVTAVNHKSFRVPLVSDESFHLTGVKLTPAPYVYRDPLEKVGIIGDWEGFSRGGAEPMTLLDDGLFVYERPVQADTLAYQLLGAEVGGRSINGTDADYYVYDGGGDYISVVHADGDTATVVFDPAVARIVSGADLPSVAFGDGGALAEVWEIQKRWHDEAARRDSAFEAHVASGGSYEDFDNDVTGLEQYLMDKMSAGEHETARRYAAVTLAGFVDLGLPLAADDAVAIVDRIPATDRIWAAQPMALPEVFRMAYGHDKAVDLFESALDEVGDSKVRAAMLLELGLDAKAAGDTARQREIYDGLVKKQADLNMPYLSYRVDTQLNPNLNVTAGRPVPDFDLPLVSGGRVSKTSMLGRYYLIDFWATWCGPCIREMPTLDRAYKRFKDRGLEIISISFDESPGDIAEFRAGEWKMPWLHAFAEGMFDSDVGRRFEVSGIPKPVLVDPQGTIVAVGPELRGSHLEEVLATHLGQ